MHKKLFSLLILFSIQTAFCPPPPKQDNFFEVCRIARLAPIDNFKVDGLFFDKTRFMLKVVYQDVSSQPPYWGEDPPGDGSIMPDMPFDSFFLLNGTKTNQKGEVLKKTDKAYGEIGYEHVEEDCFTPLQYFMQCFYLIDDEKIIIYAMGDPDDLFKQFGGKEAFMEAATLEPKSPRTSGDFDT